MEWGIEPQPILVFNYRTTRTFMGDGIEPPLFRIINFNKSMNSHNIYNIKGGVITTTDVNLYLDFTKDHLIK